MTDPRVAQLFKSLPANYPRHLERSHPHVLTRLMNLWGTPEFESCMQDLLIDTRGRRYGFSLEVVTELMFINELHNIFKNDGLHLPGTAAPPPVVKRWDVIPVDDPSPDGFQHAIEHGQLEVMTAFLDAGVEVNYRLESGQTPLMVAAASGQLEAVHRLIERGAKVDLQEEGKYTALHWAAYYNHERVIAALVAVGAAVNPVQHTGDTPLALAVMRGHQEAAALLLELRADPNLAGNMGKPLAVAQRMRDVEMVALLQRFGAS